jgi:NTP pyrophosphatase (non-canonical NTP hydrolase)
MNLSEFQATIHETYHDRDSKRGIDGSFRWLTEEVGELAKALRTGDPANLEHEVGDVLAWLASVADLAGVDLEAAAGRYAEGCPKCHAAPCRCPASIIA